MSAQLQIPLFSDTRIARRSDPATSHKAAAKITKSGKRASQQAACFGWVRQYPNRTCQEYGELAAAVAEPGKNPLNNYVFARRLAEMAKDKDRRGNPIIPLVKRNGEKVCGVTGEDATAWVPADWEGP